MKTITVNQKVMILVEAYRFDDGMTFADYLFLLTEEELKAFLTITSVFQEVM